MATWGKHAKLAAGQVISVGPRRSHDMNERDGCTYPTDSFNIICDFVVYTEDDRSDYERHHEHDDIRHCIQDVTHRVCDGCYRSASAHKPLVP